MVTTLAPDVEHAATAGATAESIRLDLAAAWSWRLIVIAIATMTIPRHRTSYA